MFELHCPSLDGRLLRWTSHILHVAHPEPGAVDLLVRCGCGALALVRTGRARDGHEVVVHGLAAQSAVAA